MNCFIDTQVAESIIEEFSDESTFEQLLELEFGIIEGQLSKLQEDGFVSMDIICKEFKDDVESFKEYLKSLNKTYGSAGEGLRVYYSPVVINRLVGLLYYFNIAVQHMHVIPKLSVIQAMQASAWGRLYQDSIKKNETDMGQDDVKIPQFKGHSNWIEFKQKLILKISLIKSVTGFTLD